MQHSRIPIAFPQREPLSEAAAWLAADVGGTKTDIALFELEEGRPVMKNVPQRYWTAEWDSLVSVVRDFCKEFPMPKRMCISFAGPIKHGRAQGTNMRWDIDTQTIRAALGMETVFLINDLEANCYGLVALEEGDLRVLFPGENPEPGNGAVISPGTGLGEGGLFWDGKAFRPFASEGGHTHFAPRSEFDWRLFQYLSAKYDGHVSWERVASGMGIANIFEFLRDVEHKEAPALEHIDAASISKAAAEGSPVCIEAIDLFIRYLAQESANLAVKFKATGGIYIGGGIIPKVWNDTRQGIFEKHFFDVGRLLPLVKTMPVTLILNRRAALLGAGWYGAMG